MATVATSSRPYSPYFLTALPSLLPHDPTVANSAPVVHDDCRYFRTTLLSLLSQDHTVLTSSRPYYRYFRTTQLLLLPHGPAVANSAPVVHDDFSYFLATRLSLLPHDHTVATSARPDCRYFCKTIASLLPHDPTVATSTRPYCRYFRTTLLSLLLHDPTVATASCLYCSEFRTPRLLLIPFDCLSFLTTVSSLLLHDPTVPTASRTDSCYFCIARNWYSYTEFHGRYKEKNVTCARIRANQHSVWCKTVREKNWIGKCKSNLDEIESLRSWGKSWVSGVLYLCCHSLLTWFLYACFKR